MYNRIVAKVFVMDERYGVYRHISTLIQVHFMGQKNYMVYF